MANTKYLATTSYLEDYVAIWDVTDLENITKVDDFTDSDINGCRPIHKVQGADFLITNDGVSGRAVLINIENVAQMTKGTVIIDAQYSNFRWFHSNGSHIFGLARDDDTLVSWNIVDGTLTPVDELTDGTNLNSPVFGCFSRSGNFLYVANGDGITVVDISDPSNMSVVGSVTLPTGMNTPWGLVLDSTGQYLFATDFVADTVFVIDVSDEDAINGTPVDTVTHANLAGAYRAALSVDSNYLYVLTTGEITNYFNVISVANPAAVSHVGSVAQPDDALDIVVDSDGYAYVASQADDSVQIIDAFTTPAEPAIVAEIGPDVTFLEDCRGVWLWEVAPEATAKYSGRAGVASALYIGT